MLYVIYFSYLYSMKAIRMADFEAGYFKPSRYVKIDRSFVTVTTGTVQLKHYTKEIFPDYFYQTIIETGIYVTTPVWERMIKSDAKDWSIDYSTHLIYGVSIKGSRNTSFQFTEAPEPDNRIHQKWNRKDREGKTSRYRGVNRCGRYWNARISVDGRILSLGYFKTEDEARDARIEAVQTYRNGEGR